MTILKVENGNAEEDGSGADYSQFVSKVKHINTSGLKYATNDIYQVEINFSSEMSYEEIKQLLIELDSWVEVTHLLENLKNK